MYKRVKMCVNSAKSNLGKEEKKMRSTCEMFKNFVRVVFLKRIYIF